MNSIYKVIKTMLSDARIDGYFTGHSLRRSGTTRLFQAGIDRNIVKEIMGHCSDAVDAYQVTSAEQKCNVSHVIAHKPSSTVSVSPTEVSDNFEMFKFGKNCHKVEECISEVPTVSVKQDESDLTKNMKVTDVGSLINDIVEKIAKEVKHSTTARSESREIQNTTIDAS